MINARLQCIQLVCVGCIRHYAVQTFLVDVGHANLSLLHLQDDAGQGLFGVDGDVDLASGVHLDSWR